jgi:hypothetical protein
MKEEIVVKLEKLAHRNLALAQNCNEPVKTANYILAVGEALQLIHYLKNPIIKL